MYSVLLMVISANTIDVDFKTKARSRRAFFYHLTHPRRVEIIDLLAVLVGILLNSCIVAHVATTLEYIVVIALFDADALAMVVQIGKGGGVLVAGAIVRQHDCPLLGSFGLVEERRDDKGGVLDAAIVDEVNQ